MAGKLGRVYTVYSPLHGLQNTTHSTRKGCCELCPIVLRTYAGFVSYKRTQSICHLLFSKRCNFLLPYLYLTNQAPLGISRFSKYAEKYGFAISFSLLCARLRYINLILYILDDSPYAVNPDDNNSDDSQNVNTIWEPRWQPKWNLW
jgi:hypothetical protein